MNRKFTVTDEERSQIREQYSKYGHNNSTNLVSEGTVPNPKSGHAVYKVYSNKGIVKLYRDFKQYDMITGLNIYDTDIIQIGDGGYVSLVAIKSGQPVELKTTGNYPIKTVYQNQTNQLTNQDSLAMKHLKYSFSGPEQQKQSAGVVGGVYR